MSDETLEREEALEEEISQEELIRELTDCPVYFVKGNCDFGSKEPALLNVELCGLDFIICHGDAYGVKFGVGRYENFAVRSGCDIALFGHTHSPYYNEIKTGKKSVFICNPGSISRPITGRPSYAVIRVDGKNVSVTHETV